MAALALAVMAALAALAMLLVALLVVSPMVVGFVGESQGRASDRVAKLL